MPRRRKPKPKPDIPDLCAAVRSLRAKMRLSQKELAAKLQIAVMTLSRFERGVQVPRSADVLISLREVASSSDSLYEEWLTFKGAVDYALERVVEEFVDWKPPALSPEQWELMQCARIATTNFPEEAMAMRTAAGEAMRLVKQVIRSADFSGHYDDSFYSELEERIDNLVYHFAFERLKKGGDQ